MVRFEFPTTRAARRVIRHTDLELVVMSCAFAFMQVTATACDAHLDIQRLPVDVSVVEHPCGNIDPPTPANRQVSADVSRRGSEIWQKLGGVSPSDVGRGSLFYSTDRVSLSVSLLCTKPHQCRSHGSTSLPLKDVRLATCRRADNCRDERSLRAWQTAFWRVHRHVSVESKVTRMGRHLLGSGRE